MSSPVQLQQFIGGGFVRPQSSDWKESVNPAYPDRVLAQLPVGTAADVDAAVNEAADAFVSWSRLPGPARAEYLYRWSEAINARAGELTEAIVAEVGKPIGEAKGEVGRCTMILRYFAGEAVRPSGDVIPAQVAGAIQYSIRQPLGVVALITPWNFPVAIPLWKAAPALAFGNTVVLKPAEACSLVSSILAQTAVDAGLPAGVFNVVFGEGAVIGEPLMRHPLVRAVSFTGSDKTGAIVARVCSERNIKFQTEMGGKNVGIVLPDANMKQAANLVASGAMRYAGQKCTATSRVVVDRAALSPFLDELRGATEALRVCDPAEADCALGPVISEGSQQHVLSHIGSADAERLPMDIAVPETGYFVPPTIFTGVDIRSKIAQDELFGPVLVVMEADGLDHALELANDTRFGLSASLFTSNLQKAMEYVNRIEAGMVRVNSDTTGVDPHAPFGGLKGSSSHSREQGPAARDFYTEIKTVQINP